MNILKKIKGLFKRESLSTLEIKEMFIPHLKIQKEFRKRINYYYSIDSTTGNKFSGMMLPIIKEHDPKATKILEAKLNDWAFGYNVKYLRDRLKEI